MQVFKITMIVSSCRYLLWCGYAGSLFDVKIQTDSNDAMGIKTEDDRNDIIECHPTAYFDMKL